MRRSFTRVTHTLLSLFVFCGAYVLLFLQQLQQLPQWLFFGVFAVVITSASVRSWEPFFWEKIALTVGPQTHASFIRTMRVAHMFGDPLFAERIYLSLLPTLRPEKKVALRKEAYPYDALQSLQSFWTIILQEQPSSREAHVALALLAFSMGDLDRMRALISSLEHIEPNDSRIPQLQQAIDGNI
ncbi:MAG TPA: tetratricopeptide repeat protein [Patescibacteria group bacterium]|nr:tetratricopeptide repeat protein [Patescibacteria group bacterium]